MVIFCSVLCMVSGGCECGCVGVAGGVGMDAYVLVHLCVHGAR